MSLRVSYCQRSVGVVGLLIVWPNHASLSQLLFCLAIWPLSVEHTSPLLIPSPGFPNPLQCYSLLFFDLPVPIVLLCLLSILFLRDLPNCLTYLLFDIVPFSTCTVTMCCSMGSTRYTTGCIAWELGTKILETCSFPGNVACHGNVATQQLELRVQVVASNVQEAKNWHRGEVSAFLGNHHID